MSESNPYWDEVRSKIKSLKMVDFLSEAQLTALEQLAVVVDKLDPPVDDLKKE